MWHTDPKLLLFTLSRHKFVAKMIEGKTNALEVGCGDGFASRLVHKSVSNLVSIDFDENFIVEANKFKSPDWNVSYLVHDILASPLMMSGNIKFDAAFSLDVFEHINANCADTYAQNISRSLKSNGIFICGCPSLESQVYASEGSKAGHINCMNGNSMKKFFMNYFQNVFLFSMNDEVLHTGFSPMSHYNFVVCVSPIP